MRAKTFYVSDIEIQGNCLNYIAGLKPDGALEVVIRNRSISKTQEQLGALFGLWYKYLGEQLGYSKEELKQLHQEHKENHLYQIYRAEPMNPEQENWLYALAYQHTKGNVEKFNEVKSRVSLSWASVDQMREYMNRLEEHYISIGIPLPVPDKHWRSYKQSKPQLDQAA